MGVEIERKFLVHRKQWEAFPKGAGQQYRQGYLNRGDKATVRVRLTPESGYITIKGKTVGISRPEFEYPIPREEAEALLSFCLTELSKTRYHIEYKGSTWEVDVFDGANAPLIVAEIELADEQTAYEKPPWIAEEVSADRRYGNNYLSQMPYSTWGKRRAVRAATMVRLLLAAFFGAIYYLTVFYIDEREFNRWRLLLSFLLGLIIMNSDILTSRLFKRKKR